MNELQLIKTLAPGKIQTVESNGDLKVKLAVADLDVEATRFELLALACKMVAEGNEEAAEWILSVASKVYHPLSDWAFNRLYGAVRAEASLAFRKRGKK